MTTEHYIIQKPVYYYDYNTGTKVRFNVVVHRQKDSYRNTKVTT